jgi:cytochrome c biogenesis protein CcmG/thiol:disulfide interchange protein DsbE
MKARYLIPLGIFLVMTVFLGIGLTLDPKEVPSPFIGKPAPAFDVPRLYQPAARFAPEQLKGEVWLLNVFASWCVSCRAEHEVITWLANNRQMPLVGLNYKDEPDDAQQWLAALGNPYTLIPADRDGRVGIDWGVYGVPETFVVDRQGIIRYKHIGPVTMAALKEKILPLIDQLMGES